jgi:hypothetical protein
MAIWSDLVAARTIYDTPGACHQARQVHRQAAQERGLPVLADNVSQMQFVGDPQRAYVLDFYATSPKLLISSEGC